MSVDFLRRPVQIANRRRKNYRAVTRSRILIAARARSILNIFDINQKPSINVKTISIFSTLLKCFQHDQYAFGQYRSCVGRFSLLCSISNDVRRARCADIAASDPRARPGKPERSRAAPLATRRPRTTTLVPSTGTPDSAIPLYYVYSVPPFIPPRATAPHRLKFTFTRLRRDHVSGHR